MNLQQIEDQFAAMNYYERQVFVFLIDYQLRRQQARARRISSAVDAHLRAILRSTQRS